MILSEKFYGFFLTVANFAAVKYGIGIPRNLIATTVISDKKMYKDIQKPEIIKGMKFWVNPNNKFPVLMLHYSADPMKDPDTAVGAEWYDRERAGTSLAQWNKEYEIDFASKSGKLVYGPDFCDYDPALGYDNPHWVDPYEWSEPCELLLALDFGQRNPTAALVGVWTLDEQLLIVDEYYQAALPSKASKDMFEKFAYLIAPGQEKEFLAMSISQKRDIVNQRFAIKVIDPTTRNKNRSKVINGEEIPYSVVEDFYDHGWEFDLGNNDVDAGITRVREYMKIDPTTGIPAVRYFRGKLPHYMAEKHNYRYKVLTEIQAKTRNAPEEVMKKDDHLMDTERYLHMTRPVTPHLRSKPLSRIQKDIQGLLRPQVSANDWDLN